MIFRPKSEIQTFFSPKFRWSPRKKKKKVFTKIETDFSPDSLRLGRWGGMHPEMEPNYSKQRLIFWPKLLLLSWWGGCIPPSPPLNPPLLPGTAKFWKRENGKRLHLKSTKKHIIFISPFFFFEWPS